MHYKIIFILFLLFYSGNAFSQQTFFIKYKNSVSKSDIDNKIISKKIINYPPSLTSTQISDFQAGYFARGFGLKDESLSRIIKVTYNNNNDNSSILRLAGSDPDIEFIEAAHTYKIESVPNDSLVTQQWALDKIHAFDAWNITQGSDTVLLGIIDTGIDYLHPDLKNKIKLNPGETGTDANGKDKRTNGIDDDGNGFIDDYKGWDFVDRVGFPFDSTGGDYLTWDNDPRDENGHGTYIAGIAGAETNNNTGIAGVAPKIKLLNIRAFDPTGNGAEDDVAAAILYAVQMKCKVINMSFGDNSFSYVLRDVIKYAYSQNVVLVASSGNSNSDQPHYPSGYSECICVGNSTQDDFVASSSNYGSTLDLVAPGSLILTTAKDNNYALVSGTSASAPFVSAAAALILSLGNYTNEEVKQIIKSTCDDIGEPGWDLHSGAGRLNLYQALLVPAASIIKINSPLQDYATNSDTLTVNATILSAYFQSYDLFYGTGINPTNWTTLLQNQKNQFSKKDLYKLSLSSLLDTVYNIRLVVHLINGRTLEERVNFHIIRVAPKVELISVGPSFYGDRTTLLAAIYTDQPCVVRMYYRKFGETQFRYITLDGFNTNNQFIKNLSYGFIPKDLVEQNRDYEIYFEAENLVGLKSILKDGNSNFVFNTAFNISPVSEKEMPYSLPAGDIYQNPLNITTPVKNEIAIREFSNSLITNFYKLDNNSFIKYDSLNKQIIRDFGDFNANGKKDLLTYWVYSGYLFEQDAPNSPNLISKFADTTHKFWPVMVKDIDGDGINELLEVNSDTTLVIWKIDANLNLKDSVQITDFSPAGKGGNLFDSPNAEVTDMFNSGKNQIWMVDKEGNIFDYKVLGPKSFQKDKVIQTGFIGSSSFITSGDYFGDGKREMAVLVHSIDAIDIAPFNRLLVFNFIGDSLNTIYDQSFIDPTTEFASTFPQADNSIRFADIDNDGKDELILFMFPYSYIFKYNQNTTRIISYKENINSNSIFVGDLNQNNVPEVAFPTVNGIKFFEFANSNKASTPYNLSGYSYNDTNIVLTWNGSGALYYIYSGTDKEHLIKIDSVLNKYDTLRVPGKGYYYFAIQALDNTKQFPLSDMSGALQVYSHTPAACISAVSKSANTVLVNFSDLINNKIENLQSFSLSGSVYPNSISPASQNSFLLTFRNKLPVGQNILTVKGLKDHYGSPVKDTTLQFSVDSLVISNEFFIASYQILSPYKVKINFNIDLDQASATNINNYLFQPENKIDRIDLDPADSKSIYLVLKEKPVGSVGREYSLKISNIYSSQSSGNIKINAGAGSYIILTSFAPDLSSVYLYPSPAKLNGGSGKVTFANLPQKAKIVIFNLNGIRIRELDENSGTGGVDYDLRDKNNALISSGIYIYRITRLDNLNNEVEEKVGKFAVIKE